MATPARLSANPPAVAALTDREKDALRLLLEGHDAKSMARHLGLSVHTVNERLRDARRKMGASSSREAARQWRAAEAGVPEMLVPTLLGDAASGRQEEADVDRTAADPRRRLWITGGLAMSFALALFALAAPLVGDDGSPALPTTAASAESEAALAARAWLAEVDKGDWAASWDATGQAFKALNTSARWAEVSDMVRRPLGAVSERKLIGEQFVPAPPYGYRVLRFSTRFAGKPVAIETLSLSREADSWKVVGYTIE